MQLLKQKSEYAFSLSSQIEAKAKELQHQEDLLQQEKARSFHTTKELQEAVARRKVRHNCSLRQGRLCVSMHALTPASRDQACQATPPSCCSMRAGLGARDRTSKQHCHIGGENVPGCPKRTRERNQRTERGTHLCAEQPRSPAGSTCKFRGEGAERAAGQRQPHAHHGEPQGQSLELVSITLFQFCTQTAHAPHYKAINCHCA